MRPHTRLSRDEFAAIMLRLLPKKFRLRREGAFPLEGEPAPKLGATSTDELAVEVELGQQVIQAAVYRIFDRLDTDGDGSVDWREMSAFVLQQSALIAEREARSGQVATFDRAAVYVSSGASATDAALAVRGESSVVLSKKQAG